MNPPTAILASLLLVWSFPRDYTPPPDQFTLEVQSRFGTDTFTTPASEVGVCDPDDKEAYCGVWPRGCPAGESLQVTVRADWGDEAGPASAQMHCELSLLQPCVCFMSTPEERQVFAGVAPLPAPPIPPPLPVPSIPATSLAASPTVFNLPTPLV